MRLGRGHPSLAAGRGIREPDVGEDGPVQRGGTKGVPRCGMGAGRRSGGDGGEGGLYSTLFSRARTRTTRGGASGSRTGIEQIEISCSPAESSVGRVNSCHSL